MIVTKSQILERAASNVHCTWYLEIGQESLHPIFDPPSQLVAWHHERFSYSRFHTLVERWELRALQDALFLVLLPRRTVLADTQLGILLSLSLGCPCVEASRRWQQDRRRQVYDPIPIQLACMTTSVADLQER